MAARDLVWRLVPDVRARERPRFLFFAGLIALLAFAQTLGLAASETLFVAELGVRALAPAFIAASLVSVIGSLLYAIRVGRLRNDVLFIRWLAGSATLLAAAAVAVGLGVEAAYRALFCLWYALQAVLLNHFWNFASDYFDALASKRLFPLFTAGTSVGGVAGGLVAIPLAALLGPVALVGAWSVALAGAALLVRLGRRRLRRWGLLVGEESDESSLEGLRGAMRFLGASQLSRWLVVSVLGMVLALFVAQYLYLDLFRASYPDKAALATFLSVYLAASNAFELALELWFTPWLIRRVGVARASLVHPLILLAAFAGLTWRWGLPAAIGARAARELAENAVAMPVRSLVYNALPARFRGRMRALLEGIVFYAGMAFAGAVLLAFAEAHPLWLCGAGALAALAYFLANARTQGAYLETLVSQLRAGRLDLSAMGRGLGAWEASRLAALWEPLLQGADGRPSPGLLELAPHLAARGITGPLVRAASHPSAEVRRASIEALAAAEGAAGVLGLALDDPDPGVRLAALRGLGGQAEHAASRRRAESIGPGGDEAFLALRARDLLADPDPRVRAEAALHCGAEGVAALEKMVESPLAAEAVAALSVAPLALAPAAVRGARSPSSEVRAAALGCLARLAASGADGGRLAEGAATPELAGLLADPHPAVRREAVRALAASRDPEAAARLARALDDPAADVRAAAEAALSARGTEGVAAAEPYLRAEREHAVEAALRVVAASGLRDARAVLAFELRRLARELWYLTIAAERLPDDPRPAARLLHVAFVDAILRQRRLAFFALELLERPVVVRRVLRALAAPGSRTRAGALEVLSNLGDREAAGLLVLLHESGPLADRVRAVAGLVPVPVDPAEIVVAARSSPLRWLRAAARALAPQEGDPPPEEETMERLLALKRVDLFAQMSLEQLEAIAAITQEAEYLPGEVIVREGDPGDRLFLLLEGEVRVVKGHGSARELALPNIRAVGYFGEMAVLDDEPRSATILAASPTHLLSLDGESLRELIRAHPEISFSIFPVLTRRLRAAESRLAAPGSAGG
jgi:HEAT repeat protein